MPFACLSPAYYDGPPQTQCLTCFRRRRLLSLYCVEARDRSLAFSIRTLKSIIVAAHSHIALWTSLSWCVRQRGGSFLICRARTQYTSATQVFYVFFNSRYGPSCLVVDPRDAFVRRSLPLHVVRFSRLSALRNMSRFPPFSYRTS